MQAIDTLNPTEFAAALRHVQERLDEIELFTYDLADEMGSKLLQDREFLRERKALESVIVRHFSLPSSEIFYWQREDTGAGARMGIKQKGAAVAHTGIGISEGRIAQVMLYYILFVHSAHASLRVLEKIYGYSRNYLVELMERIDMDKALNIKRRMVERDYLDALNKTDEPVSHFNPDKIRKISDTKAWCRHESITYRYSLVHE